ncbi:MAG: hypothetical protein OIF48_05060 [Silicimonas sp.]|nr:hypothetical protein [Silicimonas sp.]
MSRDGFSFLRFLLSGRPIGKRVDLNQSLDTSGGAGVVDILIEDEHLLIRDVSLPRLSKSALERAVLLNVQSETPFDPKTISVKFAILRSSGKQVDVRQYLVHRSRLAEWREHLNKAGTVVRSFAAKSAPTRCSRTIPPRSWRLTANGIASICSSS